MPELSPDADSSFRIEDRKCLSDFADHSLYPRDGLPALSLDAESYDADKKQRSDHGGCYDDLPGKPDEVQDRVGTDEHHRSQNQANNAADRQEPVTRNL